MSKPIASDLPPFRHLTGTRIQYRSDTEVFELECTDATRGQAVDKWALNINGIGVIGKIPIANQFGVAYGQFWVTFNGETYGATLKCTHSFKGQRVKFCLRTLLSDPSYWV